MNVDPQAAAQSLQGMLAPWHTSLREPGKAQEDVLHRLLADYAKTEYGKRHGAGNIGTVGDYQRAFPVTTYTGYKPVIDRVMAGDIGLLLCEDPIGWAITRGTTQGESKFIPMTPTDMRMRVSAGRAVMNYVASSQRFDIFMGVNLNLNFPSVVGKVKVGERELEYGYSSGIYTKYVSTSTPVRSIRRPMAT